MTIPHCVSRSRTDAPSAPAARLIAQSEGWRASEFICTAGPGDRPFEERHQGVSLAMVLEGTFTYKSADGEALLHPGALLINRHGCCFECSHHHGVGDRCLSFNFDPDYFAEIAASTAGHSRFRLPVSLPAFNRRMARACADAQSLAHAPHHQARDEIVIRFAEHVLAAASAVPVTVQTISARDAKRVAAVLRHIETHLDDPLPLASLAQLAGMSKYHFLRVFRRIAGVTPHQYILRLRMRRAAHDLQTTDKTVAAIVFDNGFGDVSTFNSQFLSLFGETPSRLRKSRAAA